MIIKLNAKMALTRLGAANGSPLKYFLSNILPVDKLTDTISLENVTVLQLQTSRKFITYNMFNRFLIAENQSVNRIYNSGLDDRNLEPLSIQL